MVGRRPQQASSKLAYIAQSSTRSCRSSICPGHLSTSWLVSLVVFSCSMAGFKMVPIRLSETCQTLYGQVKCPYLVIQRTSQFFYCNLKLGLLKSRRDSWQCGTSHAETDEDGVPLAGVLQDAVGRAVCCLFRRFWASLFSTRPSDRAQIWHACADRDETGSHQKKIDQPHSRGV